MHIIYSHPRTILITVELLFQPIAYPSVQDLLLNFSAPVSPQDTEQLDGTYIARFGEFYAAADKSSEILATSVRLLESPTAVSLQQIEGQEQSPASYLVFIIFISILDFGSCFNQMAQPTVAERILEICKSLFRG